MKTYLSDFQLHTSSVTWVEGVWGLDYRIISVKLQDRPDSNTLK